MLHPKVRAILIGCYIGSRNYSRLQPETKRQVIQDALEHFKQDLALRFGSYKNYKKWANEKYRLKNKEPAIEYQKAYHRKKRFFKKLERLVFLLEKSLYSIRFDTSPILECKESIFLSKEEDKKAKRLIERIIINGLEA